MCSAGYDSPHALCACYTGQNMKEIVCLGISGGNECIQRFEDADQRRAFQIKHCNSSNENDRCPLYRILYQLNA